MNERTVDLKPEPNNNGTDRDPKYENVCVFGFSTFFFSSGRRRRYPSSSFPLGLVWACQRQLQTSRRTNSEEQRSASPNTSLLLGFLAQ